MVLECCVAVVRIRPEALSQLEKIKSQQKQQNFEQDEFFGPSDFDILMSVPPPPLFECGPCSSSQIFIEHQTVELPRCWPLPGERAADAALRFVGDLDNHFLTKAVQIPPSRSDHLERPGSSISLPSLLLTPLQQPPPLLFIPIIPSKSPFPIRPGLEFCPFATVLHAAMNYDSSLVEPLSQNLLVRIGEWLSSGQCKSGSGFLHSLFLMPTSSAKRTLLHSVLSNETNGSSLRLASCQRTISLEKENEGEGISHQKIERISSINIELKMETFQNRIKHQERLDNNEQLFVNPLFGIDIPTKRREAAPEYFVRGKRRYIAPKRQRRSTDYSISNKGMQQRSPTEFWEQQHPLHKYAYDGNAEKIRDLLKQGLDPNELDYDFWTPLHYCAFYNRLEACQVLLLHPDMDVNIINRTGATPLHFAALNGHVYIAELILSHQFADISIRDSNGKTPLDLCAPVPKPDWQGVAFLLRQSDVLRPTKMEVQLVGGPSLQVEVDDIDNITAGELRTKVLEMEGLKHQLAASAEQIFAIWLVDPRLSLQLTAEQKVQIHLNKWEENLNKFGSELKKEYLPERFEDERVRVVLKRDARTLLGDEQMLARKRPFIVSLLYGEAEDQFLKGMLPCHEKHYIPMAAIISQRLYGSELPQNVDFLFLSRILPSHLIPKTTEIKTFSSFLSKLKLARNSLTNLNLIQLQLRFLSLCWSLNVYGCTFFSAFMLMNKPIRGSIQVHVGLNDWGMSVLNSNSHRQIAAIELNKLEIKFTPNTNYLEIQGEGGCKSADFVATITTPQAQLINNLFNKLKLKVSAAKNAVNVAETSL